MQILNNDLIKLNEEFNKEGKKLYIVGKAVRDCIIGKTPQKYKLLTDAYPSQIERILISAGYSFRVDLFSKSDMLIYTSTITYKIETIEISLRETILNRNFTINSLVYDIGERKVIDYVNGLEDITNKKIAFINSSGLSEGEVAKQKVENNYLLALKAFRLKIETGFSIDDILQEYMEYALKHNYTSIKVSKFRNELDKILKCKDITTEDMEWLITLLSETYIPEFKKLIKCKHNSKYHRFDLLHHTIDVFMTARKSRRTDLVLLWACILHDIGKPYTETTDEDGYNHYYGHPQVSAKVTRNILSILEYEEEFISNVVELVLKHDECPYLSDRLSKLRRFIADISPEQLDRWITLKLADIKSHKNNTESIIKFEESIAVINKIRADGTAITVKDLRITDIELVSLGVAQEDTKQLLEILRSDCLGKPELNNPDWLLRNFEKKYKKMLNHINKE